MTKYDEHQLLDPRDLDIIHQLVVEKSTRMNLGKVESPIRSMGHGAYRFRLANLALLFETDRIMVIEKT